MISLSLSLYPHQVILKVIRAKNRWLGSSLSLSPNIILVFCRFLRRRTARRESADMEAALTVASAASIFKKTALGQNIDMHGLQIK